MRLINGRKRKTIIRVLEKVNRKGKRERRRKKKKEKEKERRKR